jgi:hypothetical protein
VQRIAGGVLVLMLSLSVVADGDGQAKPTTPAEQYK